MHRQFRKKVGETRKNDLAAIHIARQELAMDDDTYRDLLQRLTGHRSSADLDDIQRDRVLAEMRRLGALAKRKPADPTKGKPRNFDSMPEMVTKIEALLADMKLPWSYADAIAKRQCGIARVAWLKSEDHLRAIIAALHVEQQKRQAGEQINTMLLEVGLTDADIESLLPLPKGWRRNRRALKLVADALVQKIELRQALKSMADAPMQRAEVQS